MALVWIALLIEFAVAFTIAAALATWARRNLAGRPRAATAQRQEGRRQPQLADPAPNHRTPCAN